MKFLRDVNKGFYISHTIEGVLSDTDGKQLMCEALYLWGVMLLLLDMRVPGVARERLIVAYFRYKGEGSVQNVDEVTPLPPPPSVHHWPFTPLTPLTLLGCRFASSVAKPATSTAPPSRLATHTSSLSASPSLPWSSAWSWTACGPRMCTTKSWCTQRLSTAPPPWLSRLAWCTSSCCSLPRPWPATRP